MNEEESKLAQDAELYIKRNKKLLIEKFASLSTYRSNELPISLFMAGSPGAGKTEISKRLIEKFESKPVRIDADEIRNILPGYNGENSHIFQPACTVGVDKLYDHVLKNKLNLIFDGTFASGRSYENIKRSLDKSRKVEVYYIYQDPVVAWEFTKIREAKENRRVSREIFINAFIAARKNVNEAKRMFGERLELNLILKNFKTNQEEFRLNITTIDDQLPELYTVDNLEGLIKA